MRRHLSCGGLERGNDGTKWLGNGNKLTLVKTRGENGPKYTAAPLNVTTNSVSDLFRPFICICEDGETEGGLRRRGGVPQLGKLTPEVLEEFVKSVPQWLRAVESDAEVAYISRTADCLVMSRDVVVCNLIWLKDTNTYTLAVRATQPRSA